MDGVLIIDKPAGITSHDVVARVRRILNTCRVGHTGTLDPFATGVMVVVVGRATRLAQFLDKDDKEYEAVVRFGFETDTGDATGVQKGKEKGQSPPTVTDVAGVLPEFIGEIGQVPPMYSAKKIAGKKLYEHARKGVEIKRQPINVNIRELEVVESIAADDVRIRVVCSAGTYIRTLAEDIGKKLGTGAHLAELRRTRSGRFGLSQSLTLDDLGSIEEPASCLLPVTKAVEHLPSIIFSPDRIAATLNGLSSRIETEFAQREPVRMLDADGRLLAVGVYDADERSVSPKVVLVECERDEKT